MPVDTPYTYHATVVRVIDGDTVMLDVSLGFGIWLRDQSFRLAGCNAIERSKPGGKEAKAHLAEVLPAGIAVLLRSIQNDKYGGRYDARLSVGGIEDLTDSLIAGGWAVAWDGTGKAPVPPWPRLVQAVTEIEPAAAGATQSMYDLARSAKQMKP